MGKIWVCQFPCSEWADLFTQEPEWDGHQWFGDPIAVCIEDAERALGIKIPLQPTLLEIDLKAKVVCEWEPDDD